MDGFFAFGREPSDEEQEQIRKHLEHSQMELNDFHHTFQRMFKELDKEQLDTVKSMLHFIVGSSGSPLAAQWEGMVSWELKERFNICVTCGVNHEAEVLPEPPPMSPPTPGFDAYVSGNIFAPKSSDNLFVPPVDTEKEVDEIMSIFRPMTEQELNQMQEYHLDDLRIEGTNELVGFQCLGIEGSVGPCGMTYPSIEDRMLKGPEECSGCFIKQAQG